MHIKLEKYKYFARGRLQPPPKSNPPWTPRECIAQVLGLLP